MKMQSTILSTRGKEKFSHDSYIYMFDGYAADKIRTFRRCEKRNFCKARIHVRNREVVKQINEHTHAASASKVDRDIVISKIKARAAETVESILYSFLIF